MWRLISSSDHSLQLRSTHQIYRKSLINVFNEKITDMRRKKNIISKYIGKTKYFPIQIFDEIQFSNSHRIRYLNRCKFSIFFPMRPIFKHLNLLDQAKQKNNNTQSNCIIWTHKQFSNYGLMTTCMFHYKLSDYKQL